MKNYILFFITIFIFTGCSTKTVYNQHSGIFIDSSSSLNDRDNKLILSKEMNSFRNNEMNDFEQFANKIYTKIENKIEETKKYNMGNAEIRNEIIYKEANKQGVY